MENTRICFIDTETTGLEPGRHWPWEVAIITTVIEPEAKALRIVTEDLILLPIPKRLRPNIDETANEIHRGPERHPEIFNSEGSQLHQIFAAIDMIHDLLKGVYIAGNVIDFDARMLEHAFDYGGKTPARPWHYHLVDVENVVAGRTVTLPPYKSTELSQFMKVAAPVDAHTAMGDARWAMELYAKAVDYSIQEPMFPMEAR